MTTETAVETATASPESLLSEEQMMMRQNGIGASEIAAVCGISPWATPLDIWMRKATPTRPPLSGGNINTMATRIGNTLEGPLREMYADEMGLQVVKTDVTYQHLDFPYIMATPDGFALSEDGTEYTHGLEIKTVGARMVRAWEDAESGMPDYVELQCRQNMAVTNFPRWDVAVLLGGNDFRVFTLMRDLDIEAVMLESARLFWESYILTDTPPPESDPERRRELLKALFPKNADKVCVAPSDPDKFRELCQAIIEANRTIADSSNAKSEAENGIIEMVGDGYGIESDAGKFTWGSQGGSVLYKAIAEELAGGKIPDAVIAKHKGADKRVVRFTAPKESR